MDTVNLIKDSYIEDTGGGFQVAVFVLDDDSVLVIGEESIVLYKNLDSWENPTADAQLGTIYRSAVRT